MRILVRCVAGILAGTICAAALAQTPRARGLRDVVDPNAAAPAAPVAKPGETPVPLPAPKLDPVAAQFKRVSQLMMVTFQGVNGPAEPDRQLLKTLPPGAIVLPRITSPESAAAYVQGLRPLSVNAFEALPFMIGVDLFAQERYADEARTSTPLRVPTMLSLAAAGPGEASEGVFRMLAENLHTMGFDFHVGPSLALAPAAGLKGGSLYSFGSDPALCSALARRFGEAMSAESVAWMPAGYPGGAGAIPILLTPRSQLRNRDLVPYADVVAGGVRLLNVGPSLVPTLDNGLPACFSSVVIHDLRGDVLGYKGLIVSGPIDTRDIRQTRRPETAAVEALLAGADMLYWSTAGPQVAKATAAIVDGLQKGTIDDAIVERALRHIREFKKTLAAPQRAKEVLAGSRKIAAKQQKYPEPAALERLAITLVRNENGTLPLTAEASQPIAIIGVYGADVLQHAIEPVIKPIAQRSLTMAKEATRIQDYEINRVVKLSATYRTIVFVVSSDIELRSQQKLIRTFKDLGKRVVAVLLGYPKDLPALLDADAIVLGFGSPRRVGDTLAAVAEVLVGHGAIEVLPPLRPLALKPGEATSFDVNDVIRSPVGRLPVAFDAPFVAGYALSYRPAAALENVRWDFGDGKKSKEPVAEHAYEKPGDYVVSLSVGGRKTGAASGSFQVHVQ